MSAIRIQNPEGKDLVTIDLNDGTVDVKDPTKLTEAAHAFWDAVHTIRNTYRGYNDLIIRGATDKEPVDDVILRPGNGGSGGKGGDIIVHTDPHLERSRES